MSTDNKYLWIVRVSWPLFGGACGAVTVFGYYHHLAYNADSFGSMLAQGVFIIFAMIGLIAGIICGVAVGGLTEKLLRHLGVRTACAVCVATVVNALVVWQLIAAFHAKYPDLSHPVTKSNVATRPKGSSSKIEPAKDSCSQPPPPENSKERISWDAECR